MGRSEEITGLVDFLKLSPLFSDKAPARHKRARRSFRGRVASADPPAAPGLAKNKARRGSSGERKVCGGRFFFFFYLPASEPPASDPPAALRRDLFCARSIVRSKQSVVSCVQ